jgi:Mn-dependent DtxR family transcriptional regulator
MEFNNKSEVLEIVKEDILRITGEKNRQISLKALESKIKVSDIFLHKAVKELKKEGLIHLRQKILELTKSGQERAKVILEKHMVVENYFKKTRNEKEAHQAAHILEHYISEEAIRNIKKLATFRKEGTSLIEFELGRETMISDIVFPELGLFERIVSMGIFPGERIRIMYKIPDGFVVNVNHKKIALGKDIAKNIEVLG